MLSLACGGFWSPDYEIASGLPFVFCWGIAFYLFCLIGGCLFTIKSWIDREPLPLSPLRYLLVAFPLAVVTTGFLPPLFVILPVFVYRAGKVLGERDPRHAAFKKALRALLVAGLVLTPIAYLRVFLQGGWGPFDLNPAVPLIFIGVLGVLFALGQRNAPESQVERFRRWRPQRRVATLPRRKQIVAIQPCQGCPLCWETLVDDAGQTDNLACCPHCETVVHRDCAQELGGCPTLACVARRRRSTAQRPHPIRQVIVLSERPKLAFAA